MELNIASSHDESANYIMALTGERRKYFGVQVPYELLRDKLISELLKLVKGTNL